MARLKERAKESRRKKVEGPLAKSKWAKDDDDE